jgi:hypothetical protein
MAENLPMQRIWYTAISAAVAVSLASIADVEAASSDNRAWHSETGPITGFSIETRSVLNQRRVDE